MIRVGKFLFLFLCFLHLTLLFLFVLPLFIAPALALVPVGITARAVFRENPNLPAIRGMCGLFIVMDLLLGWAGVQTLRANAASAAKGGGLMGGLGEILIAAAVALGILSFACFFSLNRK